MVGRIFRTAAVAALLIFSLVLSSIALNGVARAQAQSSYRPAVQSLPPVDLGIPNVPQKTRVWCWAAVAQQVIIKKRGSSPPQCALVAMVHGRRPSHCCPDYHNCAVPGRLSQIRKLIRNFGRSFSSIERPADPMTLYATLRAGKPVIIALRNTRYTGHTVVVTGLTWVKTERGRLAMLHINDPIGALPPRVPYDIIRARWTAAIIVH